MKTYREFRPSPHDVKGLNLPDRQDWFVAPVGTNRDADSLTRSNWAVVTADLQAQDRECDPDGAPDVEIHGFNHWACGWFEVALVRPDSPAFYTAERWEKRLDEYPVASEDHWSDLQTREAFEYWAGMGRSERARVLKRFGADPRANGGGIPDNDRVWEYLTEG